MNKNDGGPAFPIGSGDMRDPYGMTLRDYFAAKTLQGWLATFKEDESVHEPSLAALCYRVADAMLQAREE